MFWCGVYTFLESLDAPFVTTEPTPPMSQRWEKYKLLSTEKLEAIIDLLIYTTSLNPHLYDVLPSGASHVTTRYRVTASPSTKRM